MQQIEAFVRQITQANRVWVDVAKPLRKTTSLEDIMQRQKYQKPSQNQVNSLIDELDIEESIEDLLNQLSK